MRLPLILDFKGNRHYIHGSDLFNTIESAAQFLPSGRGAHISKLRFSRFSYNLSELCIEEPIESDMHVGGGELVLANGRRQSFWLREGNQSPSGRRPFDEDGMVASASYGIRSATLTAPIQYTAIEAVIALTKVLNYRLATPRQGKWVFGKIEVNQVLPTITEDLTITQTNHLAGRVSTNEILIDGRPIGTIQFIVGTP